MQFNKNHYEIFIQHTQIYDAIKFYSKQNKNQQQQQQKQGTKGTIFGSLTGMLKNYCHISNQRSLNCLIANFRAKIRILKFGTKNALFRCSR